MEVEIRSPNSGPGVRVTKPGLFCAAVTADPETGVLDLSVGGVGPLSKPSERQGDG